VNSPCVVFDGVNDYIDCGTPLIPATGDFDLTIEFRNDSVAASDHLASQYSSTTKDGRCVVYANDAGFGIGVFGGSETILARGGTIVSGQNHTGRITRVGDVFTAYLDGVQVGQDTASASIDQDVNTFIGATLATLNSHYDGRIWNVKLDGVFHYPLSENSGTTAHDVLGNENHGTLMNGVTWGTQDVYHYALANGFTRYGDGVEVPALVDGSADALGNAIRFPAGAWHNGCSTDLTLNDGTWLFNEDRVNPHYKRNLV